MRPSTLFVVLACLAGALAPAAAARVVVVAGGDRAATLVDVSTNAVVARVALPGRARTVAVAADGSRAWVGVGSRVFPIDLASRTPLPLNIEQNVFAGKSRKSCCR